MRIAIVFATLTLTAVGSAGLAQPGPQYAGELTDAAPSAAFPLDLGAGQVVTLTTDSETGLDTVLTLLGPDGQEVAMNDDYRSEDLTSRVIFAAPRAGRYTAVVTGYAQATGSFELDVFNGLGQDLSDEARILSEGTISLTRQQTEVRQEIELSREDILVVSTFAVSEGLDTTLTLMNAAGEIVAENDDGPDGSLNSQIIHQPARAGRYTLITSSYGQQGVGEAIVSVAVDPNADAPFNFDSIERNAIARYEGVITDEQTEIDYPVELRAGQTVLMIAETTEGDLDPVLTLHGPDGYPVALNDDRGDGSLNSAIAYTATEAGTYSLNLARYATGGSTGSFELEIADVDADAVATVRAILENPVTLSGPEQVIETADFRLYYTLEGSDATTLEFAQATSEALQLAYDTQINRLGWAAPVREADGRYRAYVGDANGAMGYMSGIQVVFDNANTPDVREGYASRGLLVIDNDLGEGREEDPLSLMRATVPHEFNHLVQYGYDSQEGLGWLYESTASWIETATAGLDEDAARYANDDFAAPGVCWTTNDPGHDYGQWTLLQSLVDNHGPQMVTRLWQNAAVHDGMETMSLTLAEVDTTIPDALRRWRIQNFARDYDMAPRIASAVASAGSIKRAGTWSAGDPIQETGAAYIQIRSGGAQRYGLSGADSLELFGLGVRDGQVEVVPLGRGGVFDATGYEYAALMVFNSDVPETPGDCTDEAYEIEVSPANGAAAAVQYRVDATHFQTPGS